MWGKGTHKHCDSLRSHVAPGLTECIWLKLGQSLLPSPSCWIGVIGMTPVTSELLASTEFVAMQPWAVRPLPDTPRWGRWAHLGRVCLGQGCSRGLGEAGLVSWQPFKYLRVVIMPLFPVNFFICSFMVFRSVTILVTLLWGVGQCLSWNVQFILTGSQVYNFNYIGSFIIFVSMK